MVIVDRFQNPTDIGVSLEFIKKENKQFGLIEPVAIQLQRVQKVLVGTDLFIVRIDIQIEHETGMLIAELIIKAARRAFTERNFDTSIHDGCSPLHFRV